ncbi:unnamed protein product [Brachionus calyciflorus]|uniref:RING-type domain-containing protein n=1 Tax=Brachionus calyciflorus TaxID=104777 RepID=A0A813TKV9_9BILA|nr:unnamed protein product [Brachionus calyciflorus]
MLSCFVNDNQNDWDKLLNKVAYAYNVTVHSSTGYTPYELMFGRKPKLPIDLVIYECEVPELDTSDSQDVLVEPPNPEQSTVERYLFQLKDHLLEAFNKVRTNMDLRLEKTQLLYNRNIKPAQYNEGDLVLKNVVTIKPDLSKKLANKWEGPFLITKKFNDQNYQVRSAKNPRAKARTVHHNRLKKYFGQFSIASDTLGDESQLNQPPPSDELLKTTQKRKYTKKNKKRGRPKKVNQNQSVQGVQTTADLPSEPIQTTNSTANLDNHRPTRIRRPVDRLIRSRLIFKSVPHDDQCSIRLRKAVQHHSYQFNLGPITWVKVLSQPSNIKTTVAYVRFENRALHPQIARSLDGAVWRGRQIICVVNPRQTKPAHFYKQPISRFALDNKLEVRELELMKKRIELDELEKDLDSREKAFREFENSKPEDKALIRSLEDENRCLREINEELRKKGDSAEIEWKYLDSQRKQQQSKLVSQLVREQELRTRKKSIWIRETQVEFNEQMFTRRVKEEVENRVHARLNNLPEPPLPTLGPVFVLPPPVQGLSSISPDDWGKDIKPGWDRYSEEKIKAKFELMALEARQIKQEFQVENSFILELVEATCGVCSRRLVFLSKELVYLTGCGHLFCADCIFTSMTEIQECPRCEEPIDVNKLNPLYLEI